MKRASILQAACALASLLTLAACTGDELAERGTELPAGKYPITFTAAVDGLIVTRATTDNTWTGSEDVAIQIGSTTKKYTVSSDGSMSVAAGDNPFYWENKNDIIVSAWYPYSEQKPADNALTVEADQSQAANYQASDYLEATDATVTFQEPKLTFTHRTAKVVVTLVKEASIPDLNNVTVTFVNQDGVKGDGTDVTPKTETNGDNVTTYTALLVPQKIQGSPFIKVTLGGYDYFYTPTTANDANLQAGKQHTYTITVKKTGLGVTAQLSSQWMGDEVRVDGNAQTVTPGTDGNGSNWEQDGDAATVEGNEKTIN
ncbi:fimbrillin family protein [Parabacteroides sp.]